jgi:hypothetical protein
LPVFAVFAVLAVYAAFGTIAPITQTLKVEIIISTPKTSRDYVVDSIAFHATRLARHLITVENALTNLAPTCSATSVLQCACH